MKQIGLLLLLFFISCSQPNRTDVQKEIRYMLSSLSDSVRSYGSRGWIPFLETSKEFQWVSMGSSVPYDSLVENFKKKENEIGFPDISWNIVSIDSLAMNEAKLFALVTIADTNSNNQHNVVRFDFKANLRKISGSWKFHYCEMSIYEPPHTQNISIADTSQQIRVSIDSLIKRQYGAQYNIGAILDVDDRTINADYRIYQAMGYVFEDPNHQLQHCFICTVIKYDSIAHEEYDSCSIAIVRENRIVWSSKPIIHNNGYAPLPGFGDLDGDGTTDILLSAQMDMRGYGEALWIISPDSSGGRLLNEIGEDKQSTIIGSQGTFEITQPKGSKTKLIEVSDLDSESSGKFIYTWNGRVFTRQVSGKSKTN